MDAKQKKLNEAAKELKPKPTEQQPTTKMETPPMTEQKTESGKGFDQPQENIGNKNVLELLDFGLELYDFFPILIKDGFNPLKIGKALMANIFTLINIGKLAVPAFKDINEVPTELKNTEAHELEQYRQIIIKRFNLPADMTWLADSYLYAVYHNARIFMWHIFNYKLGAAPELNG